MNHTIDQLAIFSLMSLLIKKGIKLNKADRLMDVYITVGELTDKVRDLRTIDRWRDDEVRIESIVYNRAYFQNIDYAGESVVKTFVRNYIACNVCHGLLTCDESGDIIQINSQIFNSWYLGIIELQDLSNGRKACVLKYHISKENKVIVTDTQRYYRKTVKGGPRYRLCIINYINNQYHWIGDTLEIRCEILATDDLDEIMKYKEWCEY